MVAHARAICALDRWIDRDHGGTISVVEFAAAISRGPKCELRDKQGRVLGLFSRLDEDGSGELEEEEVGCAAVGELRGSCGRDGMIDLSGCMRAHTAVVAPVCRRSDQVHGAAGAELDRSDDRDVRHGAAVTNR